jgi:hypothetical protein
LQRYNNWLPEEELREVINGLLRKAGAAIADGKQADDSAERKGLVEDDAGAVIAGLFVVCLPQVRAEDLVLDVPCGNTKPDQGAADPLHERDRSAQVIGRIVGQADLR